MFIKGYFRSIMEILDAQFKGMERKAQHPSDKGELCEIFLGYFLTDMFSDQFKIFRGGKIIDIDENESKQIDIVLLAKNTPKLFGNKGVYPIKSVFGTFSITSELSHTKLFGVKNTADGDKPGILDEFQSIPKMNPRFEFNRPSLVKEDWEKSVTELWNKLFPFKGVFGFNGDINVRWETELNTMIESESYLKESLPDLIVVNKKGMIRKLHEKPTKLINGDVIEKDFHYTNFEHADCAAAIATIENELYVLSTWQNTITPKYFEYFNKDFLVQ